MLRRLLLPSLPLPCFTHTTFPRTPHCHIHLFLPCPTRTLIRPIRELLTTSLKMLFVPRTASALKSTSLPLLRNTFINNSFTSISSRQFHASKSNMAIKTYVLTSKLYHRNFMEAHISIVTSMLPGRVQSSTLPESLPLLSKVRDTVTISLIHFISISLQHRSLFNTIRLGASILAPIELLSSFKDTFCLF